MTQSGNVYTVTFGGSLASQDLPLMTGTGSGGTTTTVNMVTNGNLGLTTDQRGFPRIVNGTVDIGAFESSGFTIAVTSGSGQSTTVPTAFSAPLVATVTPNNASEPVAGGLVTFTPPASGPSATLSGNPATIDATGTASVSAAANAIAGSYTVSATASGITTPASFSLTNAAATATHFTVSAPATVTAGGAFSVMVTAQDQFGNIATGYTGTVRFTTNDPGAGVVVPVNSTLVNGTRTFINTVVLVTAGNWTVSATDTVNSSITGSTASIAVIPAVATHLVFGLSPTNTVAGVTISPAVTVRILDQYGNLVTSDSSDQITLAVATGPGSFTGGSTTTVTTIAGVATFSNLQLDTAGTYNLRATGTSGLSGSTSNFFTVSPAAASSITVSAPATVTAGRAFSVTVTAHDQFGNIATGYTGTVRFTTNDPGAGVVVPVNSTLVNGTRTFTNAVVLVTAGNRTVTATDTVNSSITATASIVVTPAATSTVVVSSANPSVVGQAVTFKATVTNTSSGSSAVPTGTVTFFDGATTLGTVNVVSGQATLTTSALSLGSHTIHAVYSNSDGNFLGSTSANLTQAVQTVAVEPDPSNPALTDLFIGSPGATSNDQVQVNPVGSSTTGGTGVKVQTTLNGVNTQTTYSQSFSTIYVFLQNGNDNVQLASTLTINANVSAGNGNDNVQLGNGNNTVTLGTGNDIITAGNGTNTVMAGAAGSLGNILVQLGNGANNLVTLRGNGNDLVQVGNGADNTVSITGNGNDQVQVGNGNNDSVSITGNGNDQIQVGNGLGDTVSMVGNGNDNIQTGTGSGTIHVAGTGNKNVLRGSNGWTLI